MRYIFLFIFVVVPIIEIGLFIQVGTLIGLWPTLATVVLTAVAGTWLLRQQGLAALTQAQEASRQQKFLVEPVIHGIFLLVAGLLLLTPGFFTDLIGFLLLVPPLRLAIAYGVWHRIKDHVHFIDPMGRGSAQQHSGGHGPGGPIIDGEVVKDPSAESSAGPPDPNSPWNKP